MTNTEYFGIGGLGLAAIGACLGMVATMWTKAKDVIWRIIGLVIRRVEIPSQVAHDAVTSYLIANYRRSRNYDRIYNAAWECQRDGRYGLIPFEHFGNRTLIFWKWIFPLIFTNQSEKKTNRTAAEQAANNNVTKIYGTLIYVRGTINIDDILREACAVRNAISWAAEDADEQAKTRFVIHQVPRRGDSDDETESGNGGMAWYQQGLYRLLAHTPDQLGKRPISNGKALDNLIYPKRVKDLIREIELWHKSREWYREKGIPWKRGWMLYGPPGTGKTALARAFAEDMNMPIYVYNLAEMSNQELMRTWTEMQKNVPCIALIEDIDNVFHGRENVARKNSGMFGMMVMPAKKDEGNDNNSNKGSGGMGPPLTFDCLLNCLDGVERSDGIFTIITTNDISKIDPALGQPRKLPDGSVEFISTRPGRVDKAVELSYMEPLDKKKMASRILEAYEKPYYEMLQFIDKFPDLLETPAQFQERCAQIALKRFWADKLGEPEAVQLMGPVFPDSIPQGETESVRR